MNLPWLIRCVLILTAYIAMALAISYELIEAARLNDREKFSALLMSSPVAFILLTACVLSPGPGRDRTAKHFALAYVLILFLTCLAVPIILISSISWTLLRLVLGPFLFILLTLLDLIYMAALLPHFVRHRCPRCERKRLVPSILNLFGVRSRFAYFVCGVCDTPHFLEGPRQACSKCGRFTLIYQPYCFAWCSRCNGRFRRLWLRPWEPVTLPQDDCFYWFWTPRSGLADLKSRVRTLRSHLPSR